MNENNKIPKSYIPELFMSYPLNLVRAIYRDKNEMYTIFIPGIQTALDALSEREQKILKLRFKDKKIHEYIAGEFGLTKERIRQIIARAIRRLLKPSVKILFEATSADVNEALRGEIAELEKTNDELNRRNLMLIQLFGTSQEKLVEEVQTEEKPDINLSAIPVGIMRTRLYNCLWRAGYESLSELCAKTETEVLNIRNLGIKSFYELKCIMTEYNYNFANASTGKSYGNMKEVQS
ncbi:hypothetical protein FACS1894219_03060 [Clostridia bacterium]|nr:hypothetical protein FACS1894219_03060 [Clostridia bacterium]